MSATGPRQSPNAAALGAGYHSPEVEAEVRLNTNEAPLGAPAGFLDELADAVARLETNRYPDRSAAALRQAIAGHHRVAPEQIFAANGSNEVLQSLFLAYGGPGRSAAVFEPTYALHSHIARVTATEVLEGRRDDGFHVDLDQATRLFEHGPALTMLCSPNNPTGAIEPPATVERLAGGAPGLLVVDEAYGQFSSSSALDLQPAHPNVVVVRTFSKTWAMAGLRLGYLVAHPEVVEACGQVALPYHLDSLKQAAGVIALSYDAEMRARVASIVEERGRLSDGLRQLGAEVWPSDANFVLFRFPGTQAPILWQALVDRSVLVRDVSAWPRLEGCLRATIGTPAENSRLLEALAGVVSSH